MSESIPQLRKWEQQAKGASSIGYNCDFDVCMRLLKHGIEVSEELKAEREQSQENLDCASRWRNDFEAEREKIEKAEAIITSEISFGPKYRDWNKILEAVLILRKESSE